MKTMGGNFVGLMILGDETNALTEQDVNGDEGVLELLCSGSVSGRHMHPTVCILGPRRQRASTAP